METKLTREDVHQNLDGIQIILSLSRRTTIARYMLTVLI